MSLNYSPTEVLNTLAKTLVTKQKCSSIDEAMCQLALEAVKSKISYYKRRIHKLEKKYKADFDTFTHGLKGRANQTEEDDWFEWRSALGMLSDWQQIHRDLVHGRPR